MFGFYLTQLLYAFATLCFMMRDPGFGALVQGFIVGLFSVFIVAMLERFFLPKRQVSRRPPKRLEDKISEDGIAQQELEERILSR